MMTGQTPSVSRADWESSFVKSQSSPLPKEVRELFECSLIVIVMLCFGVLFM